MIWGRRRSITFRLTLLFASASTAILLLLGFLIGGSVERHFEVSAISRTGCQEVVFAIQDVLDAEKAIAQAAEDAAALEAAARAAADPKATPEEEDIDYDETEDGEETDNDENLNP